MKRTWILAGGLLLAAGLPAHEGHGKKNAPAEAKKMKSPVAATEANLAAGRELYMQKCVACHGPDGKAKTEAAAAMKDKPADLTAPAMNTITAGEIYWVVTHGIDKKMPPLHTALTDEQRWQITQYVRTMRPPAPPPKKAAKTQK